MHRLGAEECEAGMAASGCLQSWQLDTLLAVQTGGPVGVEHSFQVTCSAKWKNGKERATINSFKFFCFFFFFFGKVLTVVPVLAGGWVLLGEVDKLVAWSPDRFLLVQVLADRSLSLQLRGALGETTAVRYVAPGSSTVGETSVSFADQSIVTLTIPIPSSSS